jgi:hypothetical protein
MLSGKAGDRVRTDDLEFGKLLLCQLSYARSAWDHNQGMAGVTNHLNSAQFTLCISPDLANSRCMAKAARRVWGEWELPARAA